MADQERIHKQVQELAKKPRGEMMAPSEIGFEGLEQKEPANLSGDGTQTRRATVRLAGESD